MQPQKGNPNSGFQKQVKNYIISYSADDCLGRSMYGQLRNGYNKDNKRIKIFRIITLPLSPKVKAYLDLQQSYSDLGGNARILYKSVESSSNYYLAMEYFPKTFATEMASFKQNHKYFHEMVEHFLRTYAFYYNMRISHGKLSPQNIGISFDGKIKMMDFDVFQKEEQQERTNKDFEDFKTIVSTVLDKFQNYAMKYASFNKPQTSNWQHLFSLWHIESPLQPLYLEKKNFVGNIVTMLFKLESSITCESEFCDEIIWSLRLLALNYLSQHKKQPAYRKEKENLEALIGTLNQNELQYHNSIIMDVIRDWAFFGFTTSQRLLLISALIPNINHEYLYYDLLLQLKESQEKRNELLGNALLATYRQQIFKNLMKQ